MKAAYVKNTYIYKSNNRIRCRNVKNVFFLEGADIYRIRVSANRNDDRRYSTRRQSAHELPHMFVHDRIPAVPHAQHQVRANSLFGYFFYYGGIQDYP